MNRAQAGTQLFYYVNRFHDHLRDAPGIGFDDSSGNFERADRVHAQVDDGANSNPCQLLQQRVRDPGARRHAAGAAVRSCSPTACIGGGVFDVNPADDALVVYHEYTHGMTNRLVTDAAGCPALVGAQSGAMDEGFERLVRDRPAQRRRGSRPTAPRPGELRAGRYENAVLRTQANRLPGRRRGERVPRRRERRAGRLHLRGLRPRSTAAPRCTPTARSGARRCGTCARA